jgi:hypothetical protein
MRKSHRKKTPYQQQLDYDRPTVRKTYIAAGGDGAQLLRLGGRPERLQDQTFYYDHLHQDGDLSNDMIDGSMPFCYGTLYLYAKFEGGGLRDMVAGFWHCS